MSVYLGLMSGTSMDGIDAALLEIDDAGIRLLSAVCREWPPALQRRLRCLVLEDPRSVALGNEPVRVGDEVCGRVTTGGYGYTVQRSIAYAYLPAEVPIGEGVEVDVFGRWVGGVVTREPLFDPDGERMRVRL